MDYRIEIKEVRRKTQQSTFLHLLTGFGLLGIGAATFILGNADWVKTVFHAPVMPSYIPGGAGILYGAMILFCVFFRNKWLLSATVNARFRLGHVCICGLLALIFLLSQWWLAACIAGVIGAANLFALSIEKRQHTSLFVHFDEQSIILPATARKRELEWTEVERVILRHGNITIDCTNNFLYQWTIKHNDTDAASFEHFCAEMIEKNREKRSAEDW